MNDTRQRARGFSAVEVLVVIALVALTGAFALPKVIEAREATRHAACLDGFHLFDAALARHLDEAVAAEAAAPAATAITNAIDEALLAEGAVNPRDAAAPGFVQVEGPVFVPPPVTSCTVYVFDATEPEPDAAPQIVLTHYERGVSSFRIALGESAGDPEPQGAE